MLLHGLGQSPRCRVPDIESDPHRLARIRHLERAGRDQGAAQYLARLERTRGPFRMAAEDRAVLEAVAPAGHEQALDAGSGVGRHALAIAPRVRHVTCVDVSSNALRVLERQAQQRGIRNITTLAMDLCELPELFGPFHVCWSCEVLQHVPGAAERLRALKCIHRVLEPGGRFVVTVLARNRRVQEPADGFWEGGGYRHCFDPAELESLLRRAGFRRVAVRGMLVMPGRFMRPLPPRFAWLETTASRLPGSAQYGRFLLATAEA